MLVPQQYTACFEYTREYRVHFVLRELGVDFWLYDLDHQVEQAPSRSVQQTIPKTTRASTSMQTFHICYLYMPGILCLAVLDTGNLVISSQLI